MVDHRNLGAWVWEPSELSPGEAVKTGVRGHEYQVVRDHESEVPDEKLRYAATAEDLAEGESNNGKRDQMACKV
jgi:hypothetical protein